MNGQQAVHDVFILPASVFLGDQQACIRTLDDRYAAAHSLLTAHRFRIISEHFDGMGEISGAMPHLVPGLYKEKINEPELLNHSHPLRIEMLP